MEKRWCVEEVARYLGEEEAEPEKVETEPEVQNCGELVENSG